MVCIYCGSRTNIINSRLIKKSGQKWRRHRCDQCKAIFTTTEDYQLESCLLVSHPADNKIPEAFSRYKLFLSIYSAVKHLERPANTAGDLTNTIINAVCGQKPLKPIISSDDISNAVIRVLKRYDAASAIRYASLRSSMPLANDIKRFLKS
jgi:transcriptional regulator NrdR family protein